MLDKAMLIDAICGVEPDYRLLDHPQIKPYGDWSGSHDKWTWNKYKLEEVEYSDLLDIYGLLKQF